MTDTAQPEGVRIPREPSFLDALIPVIALVVLILLTITIFGTDATGGPLQVALLGTAVVAALVAFKNGHTAARVRDAAIGGISSALSAVFILLAVGALIGAWNMAGTIPTVVYYGVGLLSEDWFYPATAIICGLVGLSIGSSWTTAATLGVAFVALAPLVGANPVIAAGAVISGAYFGDKMTPISETTVLVPSMVENVTTNEHIGAMIWTSGPAVVLAIVGFTIIGLVTPASGTDSIRPIPRRSWPSRTRSRSSTSFRWLLLVILSVRRAPPFLAIFLSAIFAAVLACFTQTALVEAFVGKPDQGPVLVAIEAIYAALANGFVLDSGNETIDALFSRGGMSSMLFTIWLVLGALSFAAIMEDAGFLERLIRPVLAGREVHRAPDRLGGGHLHRPEHHRRRPVRGHRHAQPDLPRRVREARHRPADAVAGGGGLGDGDLAPRPVEQLRGLHGRRPRGGHRGLSAVLLLQPAQPGDLAHLRLHRLPNRAR